MRYLFKSTPRRLRHGRAGVHDRIICAETRCAVSSCADTHRAETPCAWSIWSRPNLDLLEITMKEVVVTTADIRCTCKATVKLSPPTFQHNLFTGRMHFLSPSQQCQSTESRKYRTPWTCSPQAHLGVFHLCLWPLKAPGYVVGGLTSLLSGLWRQYWLTWKLTIKWAY